MNIFKRLHDWMGECTPVQETKSDGLIPVTYTDALGGTVHARISQRDYDFHTMPYGAWVDKYVKQ